MLAVISVSPCQGTARPAPSAAEGWLGLLHCGGFPYWEIHNVCLYRDHSALFVTGYIGGFWPPL